MKTRILLIEDDLPKQTQIVDLLKNNGYVADVAQSINRAIAFLDVHKYDCILLDMSLPTFNEGNAAYSGGRQQDLGGRQILTYLWEMEIATKVLLITQLREFKDEDGQEILLANLDVMFQEEFPGLYVGYTHFHHSTDAWTHKLQTFLDDL